MNLMISSKYFLVIHNFEHKMREKLFPAVFLMLVLLIGFPSSVANFSAFADDNDDNDNLKVSAEESKAYEKQKEKAEKAREKAEEQKEKLKEKYEREIKKLEEKVKKEAEQEKEKIEKELEKSDENAKRLEEKKQEKYERELEKLQEKVKRLEEEDHNEDDIREFETDVDVQLSSVTETGVTLCHYPPGNPSNAHTITVGFSAAKAHMSAHGDTLGACGENLDLVLEELEAKFAEKHAKLEEKRAELQQKFIERAQKLEEKHEELESKLAEKEANRAEKLLEKVHSGEYFDEFIEDEGTLREFVLSFDSLTAEPMEQPSEPLEFSGTITLVTTSPSDSSGTMKFKVTECEIGNEDISYTCEFGKARTTSRGHDGEKNVLVIIATLHDDKGGFGPGLKAFVTTEEELRPLEGDGPIPITMHSLQSYITHQWFLSGEGSLTVSNVPPEINSLTDYEEEESVEEEPVEEEPVEEEDNT